MAGKRRAGNARPVSDIAAAVIDPVLRKRAGLSLALVQSWDEIAGQHLAGVTRPERIAWPRRADDGDPFRPATLIIACESFAAIAVQHQTVELIARVNAFFGFAAIGRVRIVQKPVAAPAKVDRQVPRPLNDDEVARLSQRLAGIDDEGLRAALEKLGRAVLGTRHAGKLKPPAF